MTLDAQRAIVMYARTEMGLIDVTTWVRSHELPSLAAVGVRRGGFESV